MSTIPRLLVYRFLFLALSFTVTILIYGLHIPMIQMTLSRPLLLDPSSSVTISAEYTSKQSTFAALWGVSIGCHVIELAGLLLGVSFRKVGTALVSIACRGVGSFLLLCAAFDGWDYRFAIWCFGLFSAGPAILELYHIFYYVVFDYDIMKRIEIRV